MLKFNAGLELREQLMEIVERTPSPSQARKEMEVLISFWRYQDNPPVDPQVAEVLLKGVVALAQLKRDYPEEYQELIS